MSINKSRCFAAEICSLASHHAGRAFLSIFFSLCIHRIITMSRKEKAAQKSFCKVKSHLLDSTFFLSASFLLSLLFYQHENSRNQQKRMLNVFNPIIIIIIGRQSVVFRSGNFHLIVSTIEFPLDFTQNELLFLNWFWAGLGSPRSLFIKYGFESIAQPISVFGSLDFDYIIIMDRMVSM